MARCRSHLRDNHDHICGTIDATELGDALWQGATFKYHEELPATDFTEWIWMTASYEVYYRDLRVIVKNILCNTTFKRLDYVLYQFF